MSADLITGSMCSGYGGLDMAVQQVFGGRLAWVADPDPGASAVLAHHWPHVPNLGDITAVDWATVEPVDILCAGFPCQDISYAGRGEGIREGNRSGLWHAIADALGVLRPGIVVLENVAAIVARRPGLDVVLADLAALGFDADWTCVRASDVGAPHRRERWFLVAHPADVGHERGRLPRGRRPGPAHGRLPAADAGGRELQRRGVIEVLDGAEGRAKGSRGERQRDGHTARDRSAAPADPDRRGFSRNEERHSEPVIGEADGEPQWLDSDGRVLDWGHFRAAVQRWERIVGRPAPDPIGPTATGKRGLSPYFVEWMMGLPAGHVTAVPGLTRNQMLKLLGNGVVPQQGAAALELLTRAVAA